MRVIHALLPIIVWWPGLVAGEAERVAIRDVTVTRETTELGGPRLVIDYRIEGKWISPEEPAFVFIRFSRNKGGSWQLLSSSGPAGNGQGLVDREGKKQVVIWGIEQTGFPPMDVLQVKVRGLRMVRVPAGSFSMLALPGAGYDASKVTASAERVETFYISKYETTIEQYVEFLNEVGSQGTGWNARMSSPEKSGILRTGERGFFRYEAITGREHHPVNYVSWYAAAAYLSWCGLKLPLEEQWEKAARGGVYLDGDLFKKEQNPYPGRKYPWGDEKPGNGKVYRCNFDGSDDGFDNTAPVGSFPGFSSPYGACDMSGNVAEWTRDWYTTSYHVGLDGYRIVRGGSYLGTAAAVDAISGATALPIKESALIGVRGVFP